MQHPFPHSRTTPTTTTPQATPTTATAPRRRGRIRSRLLVAGAATALLLAACGEGADDPQPDADGEVEDLEELEDLEGLEDGLEGLEEDPMADLDDPNELISDGVLAANGLLVPAPDGWDFDPMAFAQGISVASAPEGLEQLAAQMLLPEMLPDEMGFEQILDDARESVDEEPVVDQELDIAGAERAVELRFLDLPFQQGEIDTNISEVSIIAEREDGALALFNYTADSDDFDDGVAEQLVASAGFDPDSEPAAPLPMEP